MVCEKNLVHLNFESMYLQGNTDVNIILPNKPLADSPAEFYGSGRKYKVLWLLHGSFGDYTDWVRKSNVELYACELDLIVVMPSGLNADYVSWPEFASGYDMYSYLTEELMPLVYQWFPASDRKEDNFIAGLSMGGAGACVYAFNHPDKFAAVCAMSGCPRNLEDTSTSMARSPQFAKRIENMLKNAGGHEGYADSYQNTWKLAKSLAKDPNAPRMYFTCGMDDALLFDTYCKFKSYAKTIGLKATFEEVEGYAHEWRFWDICLQKALAFFGLMGGRRR